MKALRNILEIFLVRYCKD